MTDAPACDKCGRPMRLEGRYKLDHEDTDSPAMTMALVNLLEDLRQSGAADSIGADIALWVCDPCDIAVALFSYPEEAST